jgi:hypothetical protein
LIFSQKSRWSTKITLISFAYFIIAVIALYVLNPEYTLVRSFFANGDSDIGPHEFLIASTFFSLGLGSLTLAVGLFQETTRTKRSWIGLVLLGIWGVGMLMAGIFPTSNPGSTVPHMTTVLIAGIFPVETLGTPETAYGFLHIIINFCSFLSLAIAAILLSRSFKGDELQLPIHRPSLILALVMSAAIIWITLLIFYIVPSGNFALIMGILVVSSMMWLFLAAGRLWFVSSQRSADNIQR